MPTIEEKIGIENAGIEDSDVMADEEGEETKVNLSWLLHETGPGEIEEYKTHPLNFDGSVGLAQVIRGVAGYVGNGLRLAIVDIIFGLFRWFRERAAGNQ